MWSIGSPSSAIKLSAKATDTDGAQSTVTWNLRGVQALVAWLSDTTFQNCKFWNHPLPPTKAGQQSKKSSMPCLVWWFWIWESSHHDFIPYIHGRQLIGNQWIKLQNLLANHFSKTNLPVFCCNQMIFTSISLHLQVTSICLCPSGFHQVTWGGGVRM